jgi:peptidyl-prolyl cis-trans isomerase A (cyclophilin A)
MIQGGDPTGTGTGGPGYTFDDEIHPELVFNEPYQLAMANAGKRPDMTGRLAGTNGSQFFITTTAPDWLNGKHTIFGVVADDASKAVVDAISAVQTAAADRPVEDVVISGVDVVEA